MPDAVVLAPMLLVVALVVAGVAKLGSGERLRAAAEDLGVPTALSGPAAVAVLPWWEIVLGLALLAPAPVFAGVAVAVALLLAAYAALVVGAVAGGSAVDCDCFGGLGDSRVGPRTVVRNLLLLVAAVLSVVDGLAGHSLVGRLGSLGLAGGGGSDLAWLTGVVLVAAVVAVTVGRAGPAGEGPGPAPDLGRRGIPYLSVLTDDGVAVSLPELASLRPQLLVTLSVSCSQCAKVTAVIRDWPHQVPEVDVRVLTVTPPDAGVPDGWPAGVLHDRDDRVASVLGLMRPSAVLLGADALLAGGPVHGASAVLAFFEEIREDLAAARG